MRGKIRYITNIENNEEIAILPITRSECVYINEDTTLSKWITENPGGSGNGSMGPTGPRGPQGPKGDQGEMGERGPIGPIGDTGQKGDIGPKGDMGLIGPQGSIGPQGPKGDRGADGLIGPQGPKGDTGPIGLKGDTGPRGSSGEKGEPGIQGVAGPIGPDGPIGPTGMVGPQGPIGPKGDTGAVGPKGDSGENGLHANDMITNSIVGRNLLINTTAAFSVNGWREYNSTIQRAIYVNDIIDYSGFEIKTLEGSSEGLMGISTSVQLEQYMEYSIQLRAIDIYDFGNIKIGYFKDNIFQEVCILNETNGKDLGNGELLYEAQFTFNLPTGIYELYICRNRAIGDIKGETCGYIRQIQLQKGYLATRWIDSEYTLLEIVNAMKAVDGTPQILDSIAKMTYEINYLKEQVKELRKLIEIVTGYAPGDTSSEILELKLRTESLELAMKKTLTVE